ncbi:MAG: WG repeat-containing protein [Sediminibacterium sp.]|nr:WG repeat-containing protein [Sediminibacterium sp.]
MKKWTLFIGTIILLQTAIAQNLRPFRNANHKWGYKDFSGKIVIPAKYEFAAHPFSSGVAIVENSGLKGFGVIDSAGNEIVAPQYTKIYDFVNGMAQVCAGGKDIFGTGGKWGFIDTKGKVVIPIQYDNINGNFEDDSYVFATINKKKIVIDKNGKPILFSTCDEVLGNFYRTKLVVAKKGSKYGIIDKTGKVIIPFEYENLYQPSEGLIAAQKNGLFGFIDEKNNWIIQPQYKFGGFFKNGFVVVSNVDRDMGCIDKQGKITIPLVYDNVYPQTSISTPLVVVKKDNKVGFKHPLTGKWIASIKYDEIQDFSEGLAAFNVNMKYGFLNATGKEVILPIYDYASSFIDGMAFVQLNTKYGYIDKTGKVVIPIIYDSVGEFMGGVAFVTKDNVVYCINKQGKIVTE